MTDYNKYLKYKDKYLKLKNLIGGTKNLREEFVIGGISYKHVYGLYHKIFAQKENSLDPQMTTPENKVITKSELEKIIVAYFEQYSTGPFLIPGYTSFDNMILRARQIAQNDIGKTESDIKKMTEVTDAIIKNIKYVEIIGKEEEAALIFALSDWQKTNLYTDKARTYVGNVVKQKFELGYTHIRMIGILEHIEEIRKSIKNLRGERVKNAVKHATEAVKEVEEKAKEAYDIYQSTINNMNDAKKAAAKAADSSEPILKNKMATLEEKENVRSMAYAARRYGEHAAQEQEIARNLKIKIKQIHDVALKLLTAIEEEIEARIYLKEMSKEDKARKAKKAKKAKRWEESSESENTEDEEWSESENTEDKRAQRADKAIERAERAERAYKAIEYADALGRTVRIISEQERLNGL